MSIVAFDTETTGLDFDKDDIIEFASVIKDNNEIDTINVFLTSDIDSSEQALAKHHLTKERLEKLSKFHSRKKALNTILDFLKFCVIKKDLFVGMNLPFDMTMLIKNAERELDEDRKKDIQYIKMNAKCFDVYVADKIIRERIHGGNRKLDSLREVYHAKTKPDHSAINDAKCTLEIAEIQIDNLNEMYKKKLSYSDLHSKIQRSAISQQIELGKYFQSIGKDPVKIGWPWYD